MNKTDILKFVRHVYKRGQGIPDRRLIHSRREWLIGVAVFMVITSIGAVWSVHTFQRFSTLDQKTYQVPQTVPDYNAKVVSSVLEQLSEREQAYNRMISGLPDETLPIKDVATSSPETATSSPLLGEFASSTASGTPQ